MWWYTYTLPLLFFTVRVTAVNVSKPGLSTPHQYVPASDSWTWLMLTVIVPFLQSTSVILPDCTVSPYFTVTSISSLPLHGSLQKYLSFFQASLCVDLNVTSSLSTPTTYMLSAAVHVAADNDNSLKITCLKMFENEMFRKTLTIQKTIENSNDLHNEGPDQQLFFTLNSPPGLSISI